MIKLEIYLPSSEDSQNAMNIILGHLEFNDIAVDSYSVLEVGDSENV